MANQTEESTAAEAETASSETVLDRLRYRVVEGDLGRRLVHLAGTGFPAIYVLPFIEWWHIVALMAVVTAGAVVLEVVRLSVGLDWFIYEHLTREYEQDAPAAYLLYMLSATGVAAIAEPRIAIPAILMLTIGDPISGVLSADELRPVKRPKGLAVMFVTCVLLSVPFVPENALAPTGAELLAIALGGVGGMVADGLKPVVRGYVIDDDLTIAPAGAVGIWVGLQVGAALL